MIDCIFCKIVGGQMPSSKIFEDDRVFAFLDINPAAKGHILVIPKNHAEKLNDLSDEETIALFSAIKKISSALPLALESPAFNLLMNVGKDAGQVIPHLHFHLIPRRKEDGLSLSQWLFLKFSGEHLNKIAEEIASRIK